MPRAKKKEVIKKVVKGVVNKASIKSFEVIMDNGITVRTYNTKDHGKDAEKLAKQFAEKKGYIVK